MAVVSSYRPAKKKTAAEVAAERANNVAVGGGDSGSKPTSIGGGAFTTNNGLAFEGQGAGQRVTSMFGADGKTLQKPSYNSKYGGQMDAMLDSILNREDFSYDMDADPLYQQYKTQYVREGNRAMRDTAGAVAGMTGGYGSSYGATAASQANDYHLSQLNDRVPELHQLAYGKYRDEGNDLYNQLSAMQGLEQTEYGKYRDEMGDYYSDFDRRYREYMDGQNQGNLDREFDYQKMQDALSQGNWESQFGYQKEQDTLSQGNWDKQFGYGQEQDKLSQSNWEKQFQYQMEQDAKAWAAKKASGGNGGSNMKIPEDEVPKAGVDDEKSISRAVQLMESKIEAGESKAQIEYYFTEYYKSLGISAENVEKLLTQYGIE